MLIRTLDWAEKHVNLGRGRFHRSEYPQFIDIAETIDRQRGTFIMRMPPQSGKSLLMQLRLLRTVVVTPVPSLWYNNTVLDAEDFSKEKFIPLLHSIPAVMDRFPDDVRDRGKSRVFRFQDAPVSLLSAGVQAHRNQRSGQDLYLDEAWQYEPGALAEIFARSDDYQLTRRIIIAETAPDEGSETDRLFERGTKKLWHVVCVHCNQRIDLGFGDESSDWGMKWDRNEKTYNSDGFWDVDKATVTARYICPACHGEMRYSPPLLRELNSPGRGAGYLQMNPAPDPSIESWTANAFAFRDWNGLVTEWLSACNAKKLGDLRLTEEFVRKKLVRAWSPIKHYETKVQYPVGDYALKQKWDGELKHPMGFNCRFVTIDVQQNCYWCLCRSWGMYGRSRLYGFARVYEQAEVADFAKKCEVDPAFVFVDSAYDPRDVDSKGAMWGRTMRMCSEYGFVATNGTGSSGFLHPDHTTKLYSTAKTIDAWQGTALFGRKRRVALFNYSSRGAKFMLHNLRTQTDEEGKARWTIASDSSEEYKKQAYAERLRKKKSAQGTTYWEWFKITDNHAFDLECAQVVVAHMFGLLGGEGAATAEETQAEPELTHAASK